MNSIVDYLNSIGQDSSFSARAKLASQYGISNYTGTANQNIQLLSSVKSSSNRSSTPPPLTFSQANNTSTTTPTTNNVNSYQAPTVNVASIASSILNGAVDPRNVASYVTNLVKQAYISTAGNGDAAGINAFNTGGQAVVNQILNSLQGKAINYGGQTYQFGSGGQAVKTTTTNNKSVVGISGSNNTTTAGQTKGMSVIAQIQAGYKTDINTGLPLYNPAGGLTDLTKKKVNDETAAVAASIDKVMAAVVASGKTISPNITEADLANLDPAEFLRQAEASIAPEYAGKFASVKDELARELTNIGYDVTKTLEDNQRKTTANLETGTEDLAGRGLAFSGQRDKFTAETQDAKNRADEAARTLAFRSAQEAGTKAEGLIGTSAVSSMSPTILGSTAFQTSSVPLVGSLTSEKQYVKESMAKELETQARARQAYATRNLSFA